MNVATHATLATWKWGLVVELDGWMRLGGGESEGGKRREGKGRKVCTCGNIDLRVGREFFTDRALIHASTRIHTHTHAHTRTHTHTHTHTHKHIHSETHLCEASTREVCVYV
jgi:hypothetical protein